MYTPAQEGLPRYFATNPVDGGPDSLRDILNQIEAAGEPGEIFCEWQGVSTTASMLSVTVPETVIQGQGRMLSGFGISLQASCSLFGMIFSQIREDDGVQIIGENARQVQVVNCILDNNGVDPNSGPDEAISIVRGAGQDGVILTGITITGWGKVILIGSGDPEWRAAESKAKVGMFGVLMDGNSRRHPYVRYIDMTMTGCTIANWGAFVYDGLTYGARAEEGANLHIVDSTIRQTPLVWRTPFKWIGNILQGFGPQMGVVRKAGGQAELINTTSSPSWVRT